MQAVYGAAGRLKMPITFQFSHVVLGGRLPYLFAHYPNLYADLSANSGSCAILRDPDFGLRFLHKFADKLLFATDMTTPEQHFPLGPWMDEQVAYGKLSFCDYEKICFRNAQQLYAFV